MRGLHLTADLFECRDPERLLQSGASLAGLCERLAVDAGLQVVGQHFHAFPADANGDAGCTGVLLLAESHVAVHTWPERRAVTIDVFVCNLGRDNSQRARDLLDTLTSRFAPARVRRQQLTRGVDD